MKKSARLKFIGGEVTHVMDFEATFGKFIYLSHESRIKYEEEAEQQTGEVEGYDVYVLSELQDEQYKVKLFNLDADLSQLKPHDIISLENPTARFYTDTLNPNLPAVSLGAENIHKAGNTQNTNQSSSKKPEQQKPKEQQ